MSATITGSNCLILVLTGQYQSMLIHTTRISNTIKRYLRSFFITYNNVIPFQSDNAVLAVRSSQLYTCNLRPAPFSTDPLRYTLYRQLYIPSIFQQEQVEKQE